MVDVVALKRSGLKVVPVSPTADTLQALSIKLNGTLWEEADVTAHDAHLASSANPHSVTKSQILVGSEIVNADVDVAAAIVESKLSLDVGTSSLQSQINALSAGLIYKGSFDCSIALGTRLDNASQGDMYVVSAAGTILGHVYSIGDHILINKNVTGTPLAADLDPIDNVDAVTSVAGKAGVVTLDTGDVSEGVNLYYTQARFDSALGAKSTTDLGEGTNLYYTQARFDSAFTAKDTDALSEGSVNLYYTQARFDSALAAKSTTNLSEGANLYHTDARAKTAVQEVALTNGEVATMAINKMAYIDAGNDAKLASKDGAIPLEELKYLYMAKAAINAAASGQFYKPGSEIAFTGTKGNIAYLSTAGDLVTIQPTVGDIVVVGKWIETNVFLLDPKYLITL